MRVTSVLALLLAHTAALTFEQHVQQYSCTLYHIFNDFKQPPGSKSEKEYDIVWRSWQTAAQHASRLGVKVQFVAVLLPHDELSIPRQELDHVTTTREFLRDHRNRTLPTVGGILDEGAKTVPEHGLIVHTNRDIGLYPDFYVRACRHQIDQLSEGIVLPHAVEYTRLDLHLDDLDAVLDNSTLLQTNESDVHPGHDCFVFHISLLPECIRRDRGMVIALPRWGYPLIEALVSTHKVVLPDGVRARTNYRIFRSSLTQRYTFHVGSSTRDAWLEHVRQPLPDVAFSVYSWRKHESRAFQKFIVGGVQWCRQMHPEVTLFPFCDLCSAYLNVGEITCTGVWDGCPTEDCGLSAPACNGRLVRFREPTTLDQLTELAEFPRLGDTDESYGEIGS